MNRPQPSICCDTPGCGATITGSGLMSYRKEWAIATGQGWRHDPTRLRRCPACVTRGWPGCMPADGPMPEPELYGNLADVFARCNELYGPQLVYTGPVPDYAVTVWRGDTTATGKITKAVTE